MPGSEVTIREFEPGDEGAFRTLNEEWILRYFAIEAKDARARPHERLACAGDLEGRR